MIICGIDQSTSSTGITILDKNKNVLAVELIRIYPKEKGGLIPIEKRLLLMIDKIEEIILRYNCSYVFLEGLSFNKNSTSA